MPYWHVHPCVTIGFEGRASLSHSMFLGVACHHLCLTILATLDTAAILDTTNGQALSIAAKWFWDVPLLAPAFRRHVEKGVP